MTGSVTNCITTASGIVTLCKQPYGMQVESGLQSALHLHTVRLFTESDDTRGCKADCSPLLIGILYDCLQRVTVPEAVIIQFVLLKMSKVLLETC